MLLRLHLSCSMPRTQSQDTCQKPVFSPNRGTEDAKCDNQTAEQVFSCTKRSLTAAPTAVRRGGGFIHEFLFKFFEEKLLQASKHTDITLF